MKGFIKKPIEKKDTITAIFFKWTCKFFITQPSLIIQWRKVYWCYYREGMNGNWQLTLSEQYTISEGYIRCKMIYKT